MSDSFLTRIAVGLLGEQRARQLPDAGMNEAAWRLAQVALGSAKASDTVALFLDDIVVMHYGATVVASHSTVRNRVGERINGVNEVIGTCADLSAESLRRMFALVELLAFKLVHVGQEGQRPDYVQQSDGYRKRLRRLVDAGMLNPSAKTLLEHLYLTRCEYAHTVQAMDDLDYRGEPLSRSFGRRGTLSAPEVLHFFIDDMFTASSALLSAFRPMQWQQLDAAKFESAWIAEVSKERA